MMIFIEKIKYFGKLFFVFGFSFMLSGLCLTGCADTDRAYEFFGEDEDAVSGGTNDKVADADAHDSNGEAYENNADVNPYEETGTGDEKLLCVYVCGEVNASGVYFLDEGSRIFDALQMAGGMTEEADESAINLAGFLKDGDMLYFPKKGEVSRVAGTEDSGFKDSRVNINTGTEKDLMTLPGIGESRAKDIIAYREQNGFFTDVKDIMKVSGIKDSVYNKIKDLIRVD